MLVNYDFDIIVLQEVSIYGKLNFDYIKSDFSDSGYKHFTFCDNGDYKWNPSKNSYLVVLSKQKIKIAESINLTIYNNIRNCLHVKIDNFDIVCVHLEIGERYHYLDDEKRKAEIQYNNQLKRKWQLERIFNTFKNIDIIVGDFNFMENDPEFKFIIEDKHYLWDGVDTQTTPFNRVDFAFLNIKSKLEFAKFTVLQCNYSDHLPTVYEISK